MTDTPGRRTGRRQVVFKVKDLKTFGLMPKEDEKTGLSFFMWDDMFPVSGSGVPRPNYSVQETAKLFFARGSDWLRWRYRPTPHYPHGFFVLKGIVLEPKRTGADNRYYTLADIERMAHALVEHSAIDPEQLALIIQVVLIQARMNHIIGDPPKPIGIKEIGLKR